MDYFLRRLRKHVDSLKDDLEIFHKMLKYICKSKTASEIVGFRRKND